MLGKTGHSDFDLLSLPPCEALLQAEGATADTREFITSFYELE